MNETILMTISMVGGAAIGSLLIWKFKKNCSP